MFSLSKFLNCHLQYLAKQGLILKTVYHCYNILLTGSKRVLQNSFSQSQLTAGGMQELWRKNRLPAWPHIFITCAWASCSPPREILIQMVWSRGQEMVCYHLPR